MYITVSPVERGTQWWAQVRLAPRRTVLRGDFGLQTRVGVSPISMVKIEGNMIATISSSPSIDQPASREIPPGL
jgi:hypothetical protein